MSACSRCGATGCKLWREYQSFTLGLLCARCLPGAPEFDDDGLRPSDHGGERTDQAGWYVPALSDGDGGYWGYTSCPPEDYERWRALPTYA